MDVCNFASQRKFYRGLDEVVTLAITEYMYDWLYYPSVLVCIFLQAVLIRDDILTEPLECPSKYQRREYCPGPAE